MPATPRFHRCFAIGLAAGLTCALASRGNGGEKPERANDAAHSAAALKPEPDRFQTQILPLLKKYCFDCHSTQESSGGVMLDRFTDEPSILKQRKTWESVHKMVSHGAMPPADQDVRPTDEERKLLVDWLESTLFEVDCSQPINPGQVTIRRLNRNEYDNTIRDLIGFDLQLARDFPSDDVGAGFDNIGDVLSLPPLLFEKYIAAAETVAQAAILEIDESQPWVQHREGRELEPSGGAKEDGDTWVMVSRGTVAGRFQFPQDGPYVVRVRASALQVGADRARMEIRVGGELVDTVDTKDRRRPEIYEIIVNLPAGEKEVSAAFVNDYHNSNATNPRERDRKLFVNYIEVESPFAPRLEHYPEPHRRIVSRMPADENDVDACAGEILKNFASRAFRRPATDEEVAKLIELVRVGMANGGTFERGLRHAIAAVLVSPHFLFRIEFGEPTGDAQQAVRLTDYELASRLSYFLWSSMPDDELLGLAAQGVLDHDDVFQSQVLRMLQNEKSQALAEYFGGQWLNLRNLDDVSPDRVRFPDFNEQLRRDMRRETELFLETLIKEDRSILDLLNADFTFVNSRLAKLYDMPEMEGDDFERVSLAGLPRSGVLTHASVLTLTSNPTRTSPVKRGKWILENILGTPPPDPPANVPLLEDTPATPEHASLRERLLVHRENPGCASCHETMDALGFAFEHFNGIGEWRDRDGELEIDDSGKLPSGDAFTGAKELAAILRQRDGDFTRAMTSKLLTYALGRSLEYYDRCAIDRIAEDVKREEYRFSSLVMGIVMSEPFRMRPAETGDGK